MGKNSSSSVDYKRSKHSDKSKKNCIFCQKEKKERREAKKLAKALKKMCFEEKSKKPKPKPESTPMATDEPTTAIIVINEST